MEGVPQCLACGACCFSTLESYVRVSGDDHERMGDRADELVRFDGYRAYMRMVDGRCAALRMDASNGRFVCDAYEIRPDVCRSLERGSAACLAEIETKGERPLVALRRARDRG